MEQLASSDVRKFSYGINADPSPNLFDQVADDTRRRLIRSAADTEHGLGADTSISGNVPKTNVYTEQGALSQTMFLLEEAMTNPNVPQDIAKRAEDIYENLSFIGEKELAEATHAIAEYWKTYLKDNPGVSLFIITSKTFEADSEEVEDDEIQDDDIGHVSENKSDEYILDRILSNFNDEELCECGERLLFSDSEYNERDPQKIKTVVVDDWIMSGQQMRDTLDRTFEHIKPESLEINLVISNEDRLAHGFTSSHVATPIPVKAHFRSRTADHPYASQFGGAYLTAAHSTGDYPFEGTMGEIVDALNRTRLHGAEKFYMPPLANIVRPYYAPDYHPHNVERLSLLRAIGDKVLSNTRR
jgi:hypothetical protein